MNDQCRTAHSPACDQYDSMETLSMSDQPDFSELIFSQLDLHNERLESSGGDRGESHFMSQATTLKEE